MIMFTPDGSGKIINDKRCIEHVQQVMERTPGFDIVYDRGAYVLDGDVNDGGLCKSPKEILELPFPSYAQNIWRERQAKRSTTTKESEQFIRMSTVEIKTHLSRSRSSQSLTSLRKRSVNPSKPHIVLSVLGARSASRPRVRTENTRNAVLGTFLVGHCSCQHRLADHRSREGPGAPELDEAHRLDATFKSLAAQIKITKIAQHAVCLARCKARAGQRVGILAKHAQNAFFSVRNCSRRLRCQCEHNKSERHRRRHSVPRSDA